MQSNEVPSHFTKDMERLTEALRPYLVEVDGEQMIRPDAPSSLTEPYKALVNMGYAKGWL